MPVGRYLSVCVFGVHVSGVVSSYVLTSVRFNFLAIYLKYATLLVYLCIYVFSVLYAYMNLKAVKTFDHLIMELTFQLHSSGFNPAVQNAGEISSNIA